ncbi:hypothetical protein GCM10010193_69900 [Kitasatospora atroaurantiaca]|nr:hypothetical protein [Kitasatospora atroaurantiaca]
MHWAFVVRESATEVPFAEAIAEVDPSLHTQLRDDARDSGFTRAAGEPPPASAALHVHAGHLLKLVLVGGLQVWELDPPAPLSPGWLAAARVRDSAVVVIVPPGTWPPDLPDMAPAARVEAFTDRLEKAREAGHVLHATARLLSG